MNYVCYEDAHNKTCIKIPEENYISCIRYKEPEEIQWPTDYLQALRNPYGTKRLRDIASGRKGGNYFGK